MGIIDNKDVREAFKKEAGSLIKKIKINLSRIDNAPRLTLHASRIFRLFRYAHTLKGISGTCGYYRIEAAAKSMAEIFRAAKDGKLEISPGDKASIKKNINVCEKLLKHGLTLTETRTNADSPR